MLDRGLPEWSLEDVESFLRLYGIEPFELTVTVLGGGYDNLNLLLDADDRLLVLRRYGVTKEEEVAWEHELIRFLVAHDFPTAPIVARPDGGLSASFLGKPAALFRFVLGEHPDPDSLQAAEQVTAAIAQLHLVTRGLKLPRLRTRTDVNRLRTLEETVLYGGIFAPDLLTMLQRIREFREEFISRVIARDEGMRRGVVHHDPTPDNVLLDESGHLVALLDFDEAHFGYLVIDLAALVGYWGRCPDRSVDPDRAAHLFAVYHRGRPLLDAEREMLPDFLLLYFLADAAGYVAAHLERDPSSNPVPECHAYQTFLQLLEETKWRERVRRF